MRKRTFGKRMASWFLSLLFVVTLTNINAVAAQTKPGFSIQFLDVGQADAALVQCDGKYMLIDGGKKSEADEIYAALKEEKVPKLDMVVATHAHEDNVGGLVGAYQYTTADKTLCPVTSFNTQAFQNFAASAKKRGGGITVPKAGSEYSLGSADVTILGLNSGKEVNDTSIVLRIDYGKTSFLFTGDATTTSEQALLKAGEDLSADVLKVACHGSTDSTSKEFLSEVSPSYAVISVGENTDGHPTKELLDRLKAQKVKLFRTDWQGDIRCTSDGNKVSFTISKNADADVFNPARPSSKSNSSAAKSTSSSAAKTSKPASSTNQVASTASVADTTDTQGSMVWIPQSGSKYHSNSGCSNMKNPSQVPLERAIANGYTACKKCY